MIISKLIGGLGNQMFQYAAGRAAALRARTELKLDISGFDKEGFPRREYMLKVFNIEENFATENEIQAIKLNVPPIIKEINLGIRLCAFFHKSYVNEIFSRGNMPVKNNLYLDGIWHSEDYFKEIEKQIRKDFTFKGPLSKKGLAWLELIDTPRSIGVQVRRTDYVHRPKGRPKIIGCSLRYYKNAAGHIAKQIKNPRFFVFSDDISWCKRHLKILGEKTNFVDVKDCEQMVLLSKCKHQIIANSSFGWWGAWLNPNPKKIVIAPKPWFENPVNFFKPHISGGWIEMAKV